jgi:hypothetical protein
VPDWIHETLPVHHWRDAPTSHQAFGARGAWHKKCNDYPLTEGHELQAKWLVVSLLVELGVFLSDRAHADPKSLSHQFHRNPSPAIGVVLISVGINDEANTQQKSPTRCELLGFGVGIMEPVRCLGSPHLLPPAASSTKAGDGLFL